MIKEMMALNVSSRVNIGNKGLKGGGILGAVIVISMIMKTF